MKEKQAPRGSKVKFTNDATPPSSQKHHPEESVSRKKSKKLKLTASELTFLDGVEAEENGLQKDHQLEATSMTLRDPDKNISDGSISDVEIPRVKLPLTGLMSICPEQEAQEEQPDSQKCHGIKLTSSQKISSCVKSDNQRFSTTDYTNAASPSFIPPLIHPINGQVSTATKHRDFTNYLRKSGCLKLFGACVLSVYRMWRWPPSDQLMEQMLNSMGYQIPARKQVIELTKMKQSLQLKLKLLLKKRGRLIEKLDEFEDSAARYELLDQDEILPPIPENSSLNLDLMHAIFKNMQFIGSSRDDEGVDLVVALPKPDPITYVLPIQYHDKRMLS